MKRPLTDSPRYEAFIQGRDRGLERLLAKYSDALSAIVVTLKKQSEAHAAKLTMQAVEPHQFRKQRVAFERTISPYFEMGIERAIGLMTHMRHTTYIISAMGQAEAIGRALNKPTKCHIPRSRLHDAYVSKTQLGGDLRSRMDLAFHRLLHRVVDAFQLSLVMGSTQAETVDRISRAFPTAKNTKTFKKVMARMTEAGRQKSEGTTFTFGTIEQDDWDAAVKDYLEEEIPFGRGAHDQVFYAEYEEEQGYKTYTRYQWEVEQELTNDFVEKVRNGENEIAKQNGITDMQVIAIIDNKTDECCILRDGLTTKEIEDRLDAGQDMGDCDESVAPFHFNCRCRMVPVTADMPEETPPDFGSFDDWLNSKANGA